MPDTDKSRAVFLGYLLVGCLVLLAIRLFWLAR